MAGPPVTLDGRFVSPGGVGDDDVTLWWLGQASIALRYRETLVLIDPYLSDSLAEKYAGTLFPHTRMVPVPVDPAEICGLDAVLCTHGHTDHMDSGTIPALQHQSQPVFVVPRAERVLALERGVPAERLVETNAGEVVEVAGVRIHALPSAHEELRQDDDGNYVALGYVLELGGVRLYHSGDCIPYHGQAELLRELHVDVALLPVNGRDDYRREHGVPGNFHLDEAVQLCRDAGIPTLLCHHWGMFDFNTVPPEGLRDELRTTADDLGWIVPELAAPYRFGRR
jgi:L-ascorbate metabolism protein UlaG (beta-lactamase superfamily)